jgi:hypothetical protein
MIAIVASLITIAVSVAIVRWVASVPLIHTLSASIDLWADGVQGEGPEQAA